MQAEGAALLNKWEATGLLEGLNEGQAKQGMAVLLENQAKELLREASSMAAGDVEGFAAVAFPIVRRVFGGLIANDLISVQPMSLPSGLIFFLDFTHESNRAGFAAGSSLYGGGVVGKDIIDGVKDIEETGFYGLRSGYAATSGSLDVDNPSSCVGAGTGAESKDFDYDPDLLGKCVVKIASAKGDTHNVAQADPGAARAMALTAVLIDNADIAASSRGHVITQAQWDALSDARKAVLEPGDVVVVADAGGNEDFLGLALNAADHGIAHLRPIRRLSALGTTTDANGLKVVESVERFALQLLSIQDRAGNNDCVQADVADAAKVADALITKIGAVDLTASGNRDTHAAALATAAKLMKWTWSIPQRDEIKDGGGLGALQAGAMPLEETSDTTGNASTDGAGKMSIAEIDIKVDSVAVTAQTKKLKAKWSPELGQDLNAYHNLDAEVELTGILSEQIALEIDRELLGELVDGATAGTRYWSRAPGLFVDASGAELGARSAAPDFTGTVSEWYETLIETINDVSAQIHRKTLRGGANFVVCSPEVANILEFTSGFRASVTADQDRGTIGAVKAGSLSKKFDVYVDPYFLRNVVLVGRKGSSFLESGYVYAPYVPLQVTPTIFGTEDFVPRKGVMTRYAKKMVRPDMYGLVVVRGLLGESGS
jgi:hypothetical protein